MEAIIAPVLPMLLDSVLVFHHVLLTANGIPGPTGLTAHSAVQQERRLEQGPLNLHNMGEMIVLDQTWTLSFATLNPAQVRGCLSQHIII